MVKIMEKMKNVIGELDSLKKELNESSRGEKGNNSTTEARTSVFGLSVCLIAAPRMNEECRDCKTMKKEFLQLRNNLVSSYSTKESKMCICMKKK